MINPSLTHLPTQGPKSMVSRDRFDGFTSLGCLGSPAAFEIDKKVACSSVCVYSIYNIKYNIYMCVYCIHMSTLYSNNN